MDGKIITISTIIVDFIGFFLWCRLCFTSGSSHSIIQAFPSPPVPGLQELRGKFEHLRHILEISYSQRFNANAMESRETVSGTFQSCKMLRELTKYWESRCWDGVKCKCICCNYGYTIIITTIPKKKTATSIVLLVTLTPSLCHCEPPRINFWFC